MVEIVEVGSRGGVLLKEVFEKLQSEQHHDGLRGVFAPHAHILEQTVNLLNLFRHAVAHELMGVLNHDD